MAKDFDRTDYWAPESDLDSVAPGKDYLLPNGQTVNITRHQYDIAMEQNSKTIDDDLLTAYLRFVGGDMTQIIEEQIKKAEVRKLKTIRSNSFGTTSKQLFDKTGVKDNIKLPVK